MTAMFLTPCTCLQICGSHTLIVQALGPEPSVEAHRCVCWRLAIWLRTCRPTLQLLA